MSLASNERATVSMRHTGPQNCAFVLLEVSPDRAVSAGVTGRDRAPVGQWRQINGLEQGRPLETREVPTGIQRSGPCATRPAASWIRERTA